MESELTPRRKKSSNYVAKQLWTAEHDEEVKEEINEDDDEDDDDDYEKPEGA